jgi:Icc-related predicted phosphoesterase
MSITVVAISDTHGFHRRLSLPPGDILVHAGDLTRHGTLEELVEFNDYLGHLPHQHKIVIAGNHDFCLEWNPEESREILTNCIYLQDEAVTLHGIQFYGSPWQPVFYGVFNAHRGTEIRAKWESIPSETDVLITHGPPCGHGDLTQRRQQHVGCRDLLDAVERIQPQVHIFGHIHEGYGISSNDHTTFVNASTCAVSFQPVNPPQTFLIETSTRRP